jgi:hypothetical protein
VAAGPFDLNALPPGHRYAVVEKWRYTGRGVFESKRQRPRT